MKRFKTIDFDNNHLYVVGTPIGNFQDMTFRAVEVLSNAEVIYCEDTRITGMLLKHFNIKSHLVSYNVMTENTETKRIINDIKNGKKVALVSDAGMPCISDPGYLAVKMAKEEGIGVEVIPGVSAFTTALALSGLPSRNFLFLGFLNSKRSKRIEELKQVVDRSETIVIYEAPHRIKETLEDISLILGERNICLSRELTKKFEESINCTPKELLECVDELKGEMVLIIEGCKEKEDVKELNKLSIKEHYEFYISLNIEPKEAMKNVAKDRKIAKSEVYQEIKGKNRKE